MSLRTITSGATRLCRACLHRASNAYWAVVDPLLPPEPLRAYVGLASPREYRQNGQAFLAILKTECSLLPSHAVLDIGCGCGLVAAPLTRYLSAAAKGRYEGFDVGKDAIAWCRAHIAPRYPHFRFLASDVHSSQYNPEGKVPGSSYRFDYPDAAFDVSFAKSIFTHLLPLDADHYMAETARVTRRGGMFLATFFLLNPESLACIENRTATFDFKPVDAVHRVRDLDVPEKTVAYDEVFVRRLFARHGFDVLRVRHGLWTRKKTRVPEYQDMVVGIRV